MTPPDTGAAPVRIVLVDDHALFRAGVRGLIERDLGARVVAECDNSADALRVIAAEQPGLAMVDISLRDEDGIELAGRIHREFEGRVACIMLSMHASAEYVRRSFAAGARGYVVKDAGPDELTNSIIAVAAGRQYVSATAAGSLLAALDPQSQLQAAPHTALSPRQLQVLRLVAQGKSTKLIARELDLSTKTVDAHRYQISQRLGVHDVAGMVLYAVQHAIV